MYVLFDIGGTSMRIAVTRDGETLGESAKIKTPKDFGEAMQAIKATVGELSAGEPIEGAAGGVRALDREKKRLRPHPNFPLWVGEPLADTLEEILGAPVALENDSAIVGLGEAVYGAGTEYGHIAYITVSTGVGGAPIAGGAILPSFYGFEPGHQVIDVRDGVPYTLEQLISGEALKERAGREPAEIEDAAVWEEEARVLACGLNNVAVMWSPEAIVLGGAMMLKTPGIDIARVEAHLGEMLSVFPERPALRKAELGDEGGLYGALAYLRDTQSKREG